MSPRTLLSLLLALPVVAAAQLPNSSFGMHSRLTLEGATDVANVAIGDADGDGRAHDSDSGWRDARLLEAAITSPKTGEWFFRLNLTHSNMPTNTNTGSGSGEGYDYTMLMLQLSRRF